MYRMFFQSLSTKNKKSKLLTYLKGATYSSDSAYLQCDQKKIANLVMAALFSIKNVHLLQSLHVLIKTVPLVTLWVLT